MKNETPIQGHYDTSSVFVAVIGRPNVGKSSLTNLLVGEKVAIVTSKPQTTRTRITGVITRGPLQYVLLDTPGVHKPHNKLGKRMDKTASDSIADVDVSMMLFEPYGALNESEMVLVEALKKGGPAIAVINKTDLVKDPADLEARKAELKALGVFDDVYTVSVRDNDHCEELFDALSRYAVEGPHYFDDDAYTDMPEKELVAEVIREKALLYMRDEIPHGIAVVVERFKERPGTDLVDIDVNIYCERESHKGMIIGKGGQEVDKLKEELKKLTGKEIQINIFEVKRPEVDAVIVGQNIARQLEGRVSFRRAVKTAVASTMRMGAEGIKIQVAGRMGGAEMARTETVKEGRIPLHTFRADIDYCLTEALTKVGILGVKVWICQGIVYGQRDLFEIAGASAQAPSGDRGERGDRRGGRGDRGDRRGGRGDRGDRRGGRGDRRNNNQ